MADDHSIKITAPTQLTIVAPGGEPLLTIHADGRWEFRDDAAPTEAAQVFVREVQRMVADGRHFETEYADACAVIERVEDLANEWAEHTDDPRAWAAARILDVLSNPPAPPTGEEPR